MLPDHMYGDLTYDKWGNIITSTSTRTPGELFFDESVQKILKQGGVLAQFSGRIKYPRTYHLPWSNPSKDDRTLKTLSSFYNKRVVVTEKLDGENTTMYNDFMHARSLERASGEDRAEIMKDWTRIAWEIPPNWRLCGENVQRVHSITYNNLESYFYLFSIWNDKNYCLSWDDTVAYAQMLDLKTVPVLYDGIFDPQIIQKLYTVDRKPDLMEGYVLRLADEFSYSMFRQSVAKFVRPNHVTSQTHWRHSRKSNNKLRQ
jgi:hypothetical protein